MPWTCRSRTGPAAKRIRRSERRGLSPRARPYRSRTSCRRCAAKRFPYPADSFGPQLDTDALIDELQRVGALNVEAGLDHAGTHHLVEEAFHASIGHGADTELDRVAGIDDAEFLHPGDGKLQQRVGHFRILFLDQLVSGPAVAVNIMVPADGRGIDETLHQIRLLLHQFAPSLDQ